MNQTNKSDEDPLETSEWIESMEAVIQTEGQGRGHFLLNQLEHLLNIQGPTADLLPQTPYLNSIPNSEEPCYPGDLSMERRIKGLIRWNAMAMVAHANKTTNVGGHISTYQSAATLYEVGFNHFFRGRTASHLGDLIFYQGHSSPGIYARAFLEGRLSEQQLLHYRQELANGEDGGLSSYPHPQLMPNFWQFPTVSMGLGPMLAIHHAKFARYLQNRKLQKTNGVKVWAFLGDGEMDEPESTGFLGVAAREKLDNLIFVVNCNLQRLDGPVRGNGKIIQELESTFIGNGWNVIKVIWGGAWDQLLALDTNNLLKKTMAETVDGEYQRLSVSNGKTIRDDFFGSDPELLKLVDHLSDDALKFLPRGGHDSHKVYAAYKKAFDNKNGKPTVILAKTIKGYGLSNGEGLNSTHQKKRLSPEELERFKHRFNISIPTQNLQKMPFFRPDPASTEMHYLNERRKSLGGSIPQRFADSPTLDLPAENMYQPFIKGSGQRQLSTTMAFVNILVKLMSYPTTGQQVVPIIPDEARTFGMDSLFRQFGIYAHSGQHYKPVDRDYLMYYHESQDGQILEEGISEGGAISSFIAAGTAYSSFGITMIPFYIFYSMFGFQRVGDAIWAGADMKMKGFLLGATAGRTTLNGEGLQHQDGHSPLLANTFPTCQCYDPAYMYELAVIIKDGLDRMYKHDEAIFYYLTLYNENYIQPPMPAGVEEGIIKGLYRYQASTKDDNCPKANILASGVTLETAKTAKTMLEATYGVAVDLWSLTSPKRLREDALKSDRHNMLHPEMTPMTSYIEDTLKDVPGVFVAVTEYMRSYPELIQKWVPGGLTALGTDGFGCSDTRENLRRYFEVDAEFIVLATLYSLSTKGFLEKNIVTQAIKTLNIDTQKRQGL